MFTAQPPSPSPRVPPRSPHPLDPRPTAGRRGTGQVAAPPRPLWEQGQGERVDKKGKISLIVRL